MGVVVCLESCTCELVECVLANKAGRAAVLPCLLFLVHHGSISKESVWTTEHFMTPGLTSVEDNPLPNICINWRSSSEQTR